MTRKKYNLKKRKYTEYTGSTALNERIFSQKDQKFDLKKEKCMNFTELVICYSQKINKKTELTSILVFIA